MPPQPIEKEIFNRLTRLYLMALLAVGLLSLGGQLVIQLFLKEILADSHIVNIAGRQRMLSQKISKTVLLYNLSDTAKAKLKATLLNDLETWAENHRGLKNGQLVSEKKIFFKNSNKIDSLFKKLEPVFQKIYTNSKKIASKSLTNVQVNESKKVILENEPTFLKTMIVIVAQYDKEAASRVDTMQKIESVLFTLLMLVLLLEGFFIFKPIANNIRSAISKLTKSEANLMALNSTLSKTNSDLSLAKHALFEATEEKYKLQIREEKTRTGALIEGQEEERKRLALELHDGIGQMLTGIKLQAEHLKSFKFTSEKQSKSFEDLQALITDTITATRAVSFNLAPSALTDFGLNTAIKLLIEQYQKADSIPFEFETKVSVRLEEKIEIALYRIVQEALHNAQKYAKASWIKIKLNAVNNTLKLQITDNGIGFDNKNNQNKGSGINNMQTRTELLHGSFKIKSDTSIGTSISVQLPI